MGVQVQYVAPDRGMPQTMPKRMQSMPERMPQSVSFESEKPTKVQRISLQTKDVPKVVVPANLDVKHVFHHAHADGQRRSLRRVTAPADNGMPRPAHHAHADGHRRSLRRVTAPAVNGMPRPASIAAPASIAIEYEQLARSGSLSPRSQIVSSNISMPLQLSVKDLPLSRDDANMKHSRPQAKLRVLCYGDSNTAGFCSKGAKFEPYARSLEKALLASGTACEVCHAGLSGLTAAEMADKLDASSIRDICGHEHLGLGKLIGLHKPDIVIIMAGTNDIAKGASPGQVLRHIANLHIACHEHGIPTIALAPPAGPDCHCRDQLAKALKHFASINSHVVAFCDAEEALPRGPLGYWEPDIIHFSPAGSWALGQLLGPLVEQSTKIAGPPQPILRHAFGGA